MSRRLLVGCALIIYAGVLGCVLLPARDRGGNSAMLHRALGTPTSPACLTAAALSKSSALTGWINTRPA